MIKSLSAVVLCVALVGCATMPQGPVLSDAQQQEIGAAQQAASKAWFLAHPNWGMNGSVAVNGPGGAGSGRLEWNNGKDGYIASISAPITRQTWRLTVSPHGATIEGLSGGPRSGPNAEALLRDVSGWTLPLDELRAWMQGITPQGVAVQRDPRTGLPASFQQGDWSVIYEEWSPATNGMPVMPKRITATIGEQTKVKLAIYSWDPG